MFIHLHAETFNVTGLSLHMLLFLLTIPLPSNFIKVYTVLYHNPTLMMIANLNLTQIR